MCAQKQLIHTHAFVQPKKIQLIFKHIFFFTKLVVTNEPSSIANSTVQHLDK